MALLAGLKKQMKADKRTFGIKWLLAQRKPTATGLVSTWLRLPFLQSLNLYFHHETLYSPAGDSTRSAARQQMCVQMCRHTEVELKLTLD